MTSPKPKLAAVDVTLAGTWSLKSNWFCQNRRIGSRLLWQAKQIEPATACCAVEADRAGRRRDRRRRVGESFAQRRQQRLIGGHAVLIAVVGVPDRQERRRGEEAHARQPRRQRGRRAQRRQVVRHDGRAGAGAAVIVTICQSERSVAREIRLDRVLEATEVGRPLAVVGRVAIDHAQQHVEQVGAARDRSRSWSNRPRSWCPTGPCRWWSSAPRSRTPGSWGCWDPACRSMRGRVP